VTTESLWIVIAIVVAVVIIAVGVGLVLRRRRQINLRDDAELRGGSTDTAPPRRGGSYATDQAFDFSSATIVDSPPADPSPAPAEPTDRPAPQAPRPAAPAQPDRAPAAPADPGPAPVEPRTVPTPPTGSTAAPADPDAAPADRTATAPPGPDTDTPPPTPSDTATPAAASAAPTWTEPTPTTGPTWSEPPPAPAPADETSATAQPATPTPSTWTEPPVSAPAPESRNGAPAPAAPAPAADIDPAEGRLERLRGRLARSRSSFGQGLLGLLGAGELDEESWEDVEAMLLQADLGPETTIEITERLRTELARRAVRTPGQARQLLREVLTEALRPELDRSVRVLPHDGRPGVLLVVGVNGTGKTTTTGKLARVLVAGGRHVVLGAADTFRAAAAEQLTTWGERAGATVVRGPEGADPASVAFDAVKQGAEEGADVVLLDTAGRLHTKTGLMDELGKVKRVVERQADVDEVLLVLDATTGQNGLTQARVFGDVVKVTGIVLTKLDGTAKGGIVFRVQRDLGVPVKLVGLGEGVDDLAPFVPAAFVDALLD
jgi:fused signal recognition particle receptor